MRRASPSISLLALVVLALVVLAGCGPAPGSGGSGGSKGPKLLVGTEGMEFRFYPNSPPEVVREGATVPVSFAIENKGAWDVQDEQVRLTFSYDTRHFAGGLSVFNLTKHDKNLPPESITIGKSQAYPQGQTRIFDMPGANRIVAKSIAGPRMEEQAEINAYLCYSYKTMLREEVCVDTNTNGQNLRPQGCSQKSHSFTGGQGAPVAIVALKEESMQVYDPFTGDDAVLPSFLLTIKDVADGSVVATDAVGMDDACLLHRIPAAEANALRIEAYLLDTRLDCTPGPIVSIFSGEVEVRCSVPASALAQEVYHAKQNFMTLLSVNLTYIYLSSEKVDVRIQRGSPVNAPISPFGEERGYYYVNGVLQRTSTGAGVTKCDQYAADPTQAPDYASQIDASYSCACSPESCLEKLRRGGKCITNLCPGATECCAP